MRNSAYRNLGGTAGPRSNQEAMGGWFGDVAVLADPTRARLMVAVSLQHFPASPRMGSQRSTWQTADVPCSGERMRALRVERGRRCWHRDSRRAV